MIVPTILAFLKNCCKVAKLIDDIIKHRLNPIASIKTLVKHQLRVNKGQQSCFCLPDKNSNRKLISENN